MADISKYKKGGLYKDGEAAVKGYKAAINREPTDNEIATIINSYSNNTTNSTFSTSNIGSNAAGAIKAITGTQDLTAGSTTLSETELFQVSDIGNYVANIITAATKEGTVSERIMGTFDAAVFAPVKAAAEQITFFTQKEVELRYKINSQLSMAGQMTMDFRNNIEDASVKMVDVGYGFDDVADTLISITKDTGTMAMLSSGVLERNRFTIRAAIGDLSQVPGFIKNFSDIGIGAESSFKQIEKSFKGSMELGLLGRDVVTKINNNLDKINLYGFRNGVDGLTRMVQKSIEFKVNMDSVFNIAKDLFDPDKAVDLAANLQAIGGAIGDFNDPMKMMYMATNNVEGLQDALIGASASLSTYNKEQGRFEITSLNMRKAKALAEQFGMSMEDLTKISIKTSERTAASTALMSRGLNINDKEKEFLTNISRMEGGKMVIDVSSISKEFGGAQQIALDTLTESQLETLKKYQTQFKEMDTKDIAREQYTTTQNIALNVSALLAIARLRIGRETGKLGKTLDDVFGKDLEESLRAQKDKFMGKSTESETKKSFGESNRPESASINNSAKTEKIKSVAVNNSLSSKNNENRDVTPVSSASNNVTLMVKADVPMDRVTNSLINNAEFGNNIWGILNTPGSYTQMG
jgi:hypothetical protein